MSPPSKKPSTSDVFNKGTHPDSGVSVELLVTDKAEAILFHDRVFLKELSWLEYNLDNSTLTLVMEDGDVRDFGIPVDPQLGKYLQNAYQVLMVNTEGKKDITEADLQDPNLKEEYMPLIIHRG